MNRVIRFAEHPCKCFFLTCLFLCLASWPLFAESAPAKPFENYNVILIFIDALRADHLSCYGYHGKTSLNIDKLAGESFVFEENFTPITFTMPSFMSVITSTYPNSHGVIEIYKDKLSRKVMTMAEILKVYGYKTAWLGPLSDPQLSHPVGFGRGFDEFMDYGDIFRHEELRERLLGWLDRNKDKKFFLNFHTYKIHSPYLPSRKYKEKFTGIKEMKGVIEDEWNFLVGAPVRLCRRDRKLADSIIGEGLLREFIAAGLLEGDCAQIENFFYAKKKPHIWFYFREHAYWERINLGDPAANAYVQVLYDAEILEFDTEVIAPLIKRLKAADIYDKTVIVIFADHGEEFYEHNGHSHGSTLYDEVTHVPLIIRLPWVKEGRRVKDLAQTVDIMPTILDLLGIPVPHQAQGISLANLMRDKKSSPPREYVFGQLREMSSIRSKEWLFVLHKSHPGEKELYHLVSDPKEQRNLYPGHRDIALKMESALKRWEESLPSYRDQEYSFPPEIDKETQERIRKTGYW